jgi:phosphoglycerate dehydrogenase-like enzyme
MTVVGNDVEPIAEDLRRETGVRAVDKAELFDESDVVSLNCALTSAAEGLVGPAELERLGPEGYLINTARGGLIDESAFIDALCQERIAGAALDVFTEEPLPPDSPLTGLSGVILGSHNALNTVEAVERVHVRAVENLINGLTTHEP